MRRDSLRSRLRRLESQTLLDQSPPEQQGPSIREQLEADDPVRFAQLVECVGRVDNSWTACTSHRADHHEDEEDEAVDFDDCVNLLRDHGLIENDCRWCEVQGDR